ncbi:Uncharacterised protein [Vibrio cholerae]|nr:Uncharacterised protein [Vibrio cholerae]
MTSLRKVYVNKSRFSELCSTKKPLRHSSSLYFWLH